MLRIPTLAFGFVLASLASGQSNRDDLTPLEIEYTTTVAEDFGLMESVQRGIKSRGYRPGPLILDPSGVADIHSENTVAHLQRLVLDHL